MSTPSATLFSAQLTQAKNETHETVKKTKQNQSANTKATTPKPNTHNQNYDNVSAFNEMENKKNI